MQIGELELSIREEIVIRTQTGRLTLPIGCVQPSQQGRVVLTRRELCAWGNKWIRHGSGRTHKGGDGNDGLHVFKNRGIDVAGRGSVEYVCGCRCGRAMQICEGK